MTTSGQEVVNDHPVRRQLQPIQNHNKRSIRDTETSHFCWSLCLLMTTTTATIWISNVLFGSFALFHYLKSYFFIPPLMESNDGDGRNHNFKTTSAADTTKYQWDLTDPNLYKKNSTFANRVMVLHLIGGTFLMIAGPIQFLSYVRRHYMVVHKWIGRLYVMAALMASGFGLLFTAMYKSSRCNIHEDISNFILGGCSFVSAIQTFRYAAVQRDITRHQLWAWRLYGSILGAPFFRLYAGIYFCLVYWTKWDGSLFWANKGLFYINTLPNLIVVQILWERKKQGLPLASIGLWVYVAVVLVAIATSIPFFLLWLPSIMGTLRTQLPQEDEGGAIGVAYPSDFCDNKF